MRLPEVGVVPEYRRSMVLRWLPDPDTTASVGYIESGGRVWVGDAHLAATRLGIPGDGDRYLEAVAALVGGTVRRYEKESTSPQVLGPDGRTLDVAALLDVEEGWLSAIGDLVTAAAKRVR